MNENGLASFEPENVEGTIESGELYVTVRDGIFESAKLELSYQGADSNLYQYIKEW